MSSASVDDVSADSPDATFDEFLNKWTRHLDALTTHAAALPDKSDLAFLRTMDRDLAKTLDETSGRVLRMTSDLLELVESGSTNKRRRIESEDDVIEGYRRRVVDSNNALLEDAVRR
jgi:exosome complex exonuclease RRP6